MNSQDLHNLQEVYSQVYGLDEVSNAKVAAVGKARQKNVDKAFDKLDDSRGSSQNLATAISKQQKNQRLSAKRDKRNEAVDLYDIILSHLLDEGYAETPQAAEVIMVNMSEDWRESICEGYVPLRTSDEHYDDEGFPTTTRSWSNKMTDARIGVGKVKDRSRRNSGDPIGNLTKGVSAKKRLDAMKKVDDEPESVRAKRSQAKAAANRQLGTNRRSLQTSLDREHLTKSLKSS